MSAVRRLVPIEEKEEETVSVEGFWLGMKGTVAGRRSEVEENG